MNLYFITGSKGKFSEVLQVLPGVEHLDINLPEIQEIDPKKIITAKLLEAFKHHRGQFIVEDTSLYLDCLHGLPGPLIKWFLLTNGIEGIAKIAHTLGNNKATVKTFIGYAKSKADICFFEGEVTGEVVSPRGGNGFGWDPIFMPKGSKKTFGEMEPAEKRNYSMREIAAEGLKKFLESGRSA